MAARDGETRCGATLPVYSSTAVLHDERAPLSRAVSPFRGWTAEL
jgi:hypothetical protein